MRRLAIAILKERLLLAEICSLCLKICKIEVTRLGCPASFFFFFFNSPLLFRHIGDFEMVRSFCTILDQYNVTLFLSFLFQIRCQASLIGWIGQKYPGLAHFAYWTSGDRKLQKPLMPIGKYAKVMLFYAGQSWRSVDQLASALLLKLNRKWQRIPSWKKLNYFTVIPPCKM